MSNQEENETLVLTLVSGGGGAPIENVQDVRDLAAIAKRLGLGELTTHQRHAERCALLASQVFELGRIAESSLGADGVIDAFFVGLMRYAHDRDISEEKLMEAWATLSADIREIEGG
jgi:hypothetical protein